MSSAQVGKTTIVENVTGYHIQHDPAPIMILQPNQKPMGESFSKDKIAPMIRDSPALRARVSDPKSRDSGNTMLHKTFAGGHLTIAGANSPSSLASRPIRILLCDEVDRYQPTSEGDPIRLANARTTTFWNRKRGYFSTPHLAGGRIDQLYQESDQRKYYQPCPHCGVDICLEFQHLKWEEAPPENGADGSPLRRAAQAWFECPECESKISDSERHQSVKAGQWRATKPFSGRAGFWLWAGISPWVSAKQIADSWLGALGRPEQERAVKNTVLGLPWQESGDAPDWEKIYLRQIDPFEQLPADVLFLTAGVDVQKDRLEVSIYGWGRGRQSWLVEHVVLPGDVSSAEVWQDLDNLIGTTFRHECGLDLSIVRVAVDSGHATQEVYQWVRRHSGASVIAVDGRSGGQALIGQPSAVDVNTSGKRIRRGVQLWPVNVSMAKSEFYGWLRLERPKDGDPFPPGWCHFQGQNEEFFRQLTAEQWQTRLVKGFRRGEWVKTRERNEALDCRNYARAAAAHLGMDRWGDQQWAAMENAVNGSVKPAPPSQSPPDSEPGGGQLVKVRRRGFRGFRMG